ncbi:S ribosomal protein S31%2C mitochondrial [Xyrichtys novacula]|uniref:Small ribosomal subunit protein mS31 n=1 Tax=Xyrichtys novacula TaxID=13765 RepID=A0AAV1FUM4_XYRNO|nr:S ribosomal protein S31%2C mitochondrial [Xyrichtys novacula]
MFRLLLRTAHAARKSSFSVYESCLATSKCDKNAAQHFRVANGGGARALSTTSARHCEKKDEPALSQDEEKINEAKDADPTEKSTLVIHKTENNKLTEQSEQPEGLKTDEGGAMQTGVGVEEVVAATKQVETETKAEKNGKESLIDLLGAMKVDVTTKKKRNLKPKRIISGSAPRPNPADMESTISMFQKATMEAASQSETLDPNLVAAASAAASTLPNRNQAQSELLRQLRENEATTQAQKKGDINHLGMLIADMKVGKHYRRQNSRPSNQIRFDEDGKGYTEERRERGVSAELDGVRRRDLFSGRRLNIFSTASDEGTVETAVAQPTLWDIDFANQLSLSTNQLPRNGLEEVIQWTKEGKIWQYPINNEAGLEEEAQVMFHEHIFLDQHLEEGFPRQGPVRHFMELVVAGLSRNPYLTVQQKKEHISWFRDYFHQKQEILKEADVYISEA